MSAVSRSLPIPACAASVLETDVFELAQDTGAFGLDDDDAAAYVSLAAMVTGQRLLVPDDASARETAWRLLNDLSNAYDAQAEAGKDAAFARAASRGLQTLASKVLR